VDLVRWRPSGWLVGARRELLVRAGDPAAAVAAKLAEESGVGAGALRLAKSSHWSGTPRFELEGLAWAEVPRVPAGEGAIRALALSEGELYYYKDVEEAPKTLSEQEQAAAKVRPAPVGQSCSRFRV